jgi:hypothetical protein
MRRPASDCIGFLPLMLQDGALTTELVAIAQHWCWENLALSQAITDACIARLQGEVAGSGDFRPVLQVLAALVLLEDTQQVGRMAEALDKLFRILQFESRGRRADDRLLLFATKQLLACSLRSKMVADWLALREGKWMKWAANSR